MDLARFGAIYYRISSSISTLDRGNELVGCFFPSATNFTATQVLVVTWFDVAEAFSSIREVRWITEGYIRDTLAAVPSFFSFQSNTFQVALVYNDFYSFAFFFYGDMEWGESSNIGFHPSLIPDFASPLSRSFQLPIALTPETVNIEETSNVRLPGFYAFRIDQPIIQQAESK